MSPLLCLAQIKASAPENHIVTMGDKLSNAILQGQQTRTTVDESYVIDTERTLQVCHLQKFVQNNIGISVTLDVYNDTHAFATGLIVNIADARNLLLIAERRNLFD